MQKTIFVFAAAISAASAFAADGRGMKIASPIINDLSTAENRPIYEAEFRRAGVDRVHLCPGGIFGDGPETGKKISLLKENLDYYKKAGYETTVWIWTFTQWAVSSDPATQADAMKIRKMTDIHTGKTDNSYCPMDETFIRLAAEYLKKVAVAGAPMILFDDDYRFGYMGAVTMGCACPEHVAEFNRRARAEGLTERDWTREELAKTLFTGKPTPLRRVWMKTTGGSLIHFAKEMRRAVDSVDPKTRLAHCACMSSWDLDGTDNFEIARALAGGTKPFLRFIGAPYWVRNRNFNAQSLAAVVDAERMQAAWAKEFAPDIEIFSEGDCFPRPRYIQPASYVECFDQVLGAEGQFDGILKYMFDYNFQPDYERGYVNVHCRFAGLRNEIHATFAGKETAGVYIPVAMRKVVDMDCTGVNPSTLATALIPPEVIAANACSLPISFERTPYTKVAMAFGENARHLGKRSDGMPLILDSAAAAILTAEGKDVGWNEHQPCRAPYFHTNAAGESFFVYDFVMDNDASRMSDYTRQDELFSAVERLQGAPAVAKLLREPGAYLICRQNGKALAVGIWNFGDDIVLPHTVELDRAYNGIQFIGETRGRLDGNKVHLDTVVYPSAFNGFIVSLD